MKASEMTGTMAFALRKKGQQILDTFEAECREMWRRAYVASMRSPGSTTLGCARIADEVVRLYRERYSPAGERGDAT